MELEYYTRRIIEQKKLPYRCGKCVIVHSPSTKIWINHISKALVCRPWISETVLTEAQTLKANADTEKQKMIQEDNLRVQKELSTKLENSPKEMWLFYRIDSGYGFRFLGRAGGYKTKEELLSDNQYSITDAKEGNGIVMIFKAVPEEIIKGF